MGIHRPTPIFAVTADGRRASSEGAWEPLRPGTGYYLWIHIISFTERRHTAGARLCSASLGDVGCTCMFAVRVVAQTMTTAQREHSQCSVSTMWSGDIRGFWTTLQGNGRKIKNERVVSCIKSHCD